MKNTLFFLLVLPLVWFVVAAITAQPAANKVYALAIAPSVWVYFFDRSLQVSSGLVRLSGLLPMFLVGLVLLKSKMKPGVTIICSVVITFILWFALLITVSNSNAIKAPGAPLLWLLCCFNFSLCLVPFFALPIMLVSKMRKASKQS